MITSLSIALLIAAASILIGMAFWHTWLQKWEVAAMIPVPLLVCTGIYSIGACSVNTDHDVVTSWIQQVEYDEAWNERQARTRTVTVGKTTITQVYYVTVEHAPHWRAISAHGYKIKISQARYNEIVHHWNAVPQFVELNRPSYTRDGDRYVAHFPGDDASLLPITSSESYTNKVLGSLSTFNFDRPVNDSVLPYPSVIYEAMPSVIGASCSAEELHAFNVLNARLGVAHGVRVWVVIALDQPLSFALDQEAAWRGGHRSDFVLCVGVNGERKVQWCHVFSWSTSDTLKVQLRQQVTSQDKLDLLPVAAWLRENIPGNYLRRDFAEFDYLATNVPWWVFLIGAVVAIAANCGLMFWLVNNDYHDETLSWRGKWYR